MSLDYGFGTMAANTFYVWRLFCHCLFEIYDKRNDFDFEIVVFPFLDGDTPRINYIKNY